MACLVGHSEDSLVANYQHGEEVNRVVVVDFYNHTREAFPLEVVEVVGPIDTVLADVVVGIG